MTIKFGTDGWRAIVGDDFTAENVGKVIQAFCELYPKLENTGKGVIIGFDRRNQSPESAQQIAAILVGNGIKASLASSFCPTPAVSWYTKHHNCTAGIMVTASHNPAQWNGIKFKESSGGAASEDFVRPIEEQIIVNDERGKTPNIADISSGHELLSHFDPKKDYLESMQSLVDIERIKSKSFKILVEPMYGAGIGFFSKLLGDNVTELHNQRDLNFGGIHPEPIPPHVNEALETVKNNAYDCGLILDGDADRAGLIDENGNFVTTQEIYSLLLQHVIKHKKWPGKKVIKSVSTTQMINRLANTFELELDMVPVGFKHISPAMNKADVLMGGEESGGFGFPLHVPERDGILSNLLLLELMAITGKTLSSLVAELQQNFGPCKYKRNDYKLSTKQIATAREKFNSLDIKECAGHKTIEHINIDGHRFLFDDNSKYARRSI